MINKGKKEEDGTVPSPIKELKKETELNYLGYFGLHHLKYFMRIGHNIAGKMFFVHY